MTIETNILREWDRIVESAALFAIIILAIGIIVRAVKVSDVVKHLGTILCILILLFLLPAIMVSAWLSMSHWQQLGVFALGIMVGLLLWGLRQPRKKRKEH